MQETDINHWLCDELFERMPNTIAIIDREFRIIRANRKFVNTFGAWENKLCHEVFKDRSGSLRLMQG